MIFQEGYIWKIFFKDIDNYFQKHKKKKIQIKFFWKVSIYFFSDFVVIQHLVSYVCFSLFTLDPVRCCLHLSFSILSLNVHASKHNRSFKLYAKRERKGGHISSSPCSYWLEIFKGGSLNSDRASITRGGGGKYSRCEKKKGEEVTR